MRADLEIWAVLANGGRIELARAANRQTLSDAIHKASYLLGRNDWFGVFIRDVETGKQEWADYRSVPLFENKPPKARHRTKAHAPPPYLR